jgi:putative PIN family toxin of toxin-antitoxin system
MTEPLSAELRAVIDVNLLVRGILSQTGSSARLIQLLKQGRFVVVTSRTHLEELYRVLGYARLVRKYRLTRGHRQRIVVQLYKRGIWVELSGALSLCRDPNDDYLIEMALLGRSSYLVSEDKDLVNDANISLFLSQRHIQLVRLNEFLAVLQN